MPAGMQRILVTGANKGIGLAIVESVLEQAPDASVLLGSRDAARGAAALERLVAENPAWQGRVAVVPLDVSSDASVRAAAAETAEHHGRRPAPLSGIVNNAGIGGEYALRDMLEVNVHGLRRVCEAFIPLLEPDGGRIVNVTSAAGPMFVEKCSSRWRSLLTDEAVEWSALSTFMQTALEADAPDAAGALTEPGNAYGLSKACANAYTLLLAREHPRLVINACTPGFIETDMTRPFAVARGKAPREMGMKSPREGAIAPCFLLFGESVGRGYFYGSDARRSPLDRYRAPGTPAYDDASS